MRTIRVCPLCQRPKTLLQGELVCSNGRCEEYGGTKSRKHRAELRKRGTREPSRIIDPASQLVVPTGVKVKR